MEIIDNFLKIIKRKPINILWHLFLGFIGSALTFLVLWLCGAGQWASWCGFIAGSCVGFGVEGFQIVHIKWGLPLEDWLQESIMDILEYMLGAAIIFTLFLI